MNGQSLHPETLPPKQEVRTLHPKDTLLLRAVRSPCNPVAEDKLLVLLAASAHVTDVQVLEPKKQNAALRERACVFTRFLIGIHVEDLHDQTMQVTA